VVLRRTVWIHQRPRITASRHAGYWILLEFAFGRLANSAPFSVCLVGNVGSLIRSHRYRTTAVLLSPGRAVLCGSRGPYENASFGGCKDIEDADPGGNRDKVVAQSSDQQHFSSNSEWSPSPRRCFLRCMPPFGDDDLEARSAERPSTARPAFADNGRVGHELRLGDETRVLWRRLSRDV